MPLHQEKMNPNAEPFLQPPTGNPVKTGPLHNSLIAPNTEYPHSEQPVLKSWGDKEKYIPSITLIGSHVTGETGEIRDPEISECYRTQELSPEVQKVFSPTLVYRIR